MGRIGRVYILINLNIENCKMYVGSTCTKLSARFSCHKYQCKRGVTSMVYNYIRENGGIDEWSILQVEEIEFNEKIELLMLEQTYKDKCGRLNKNKTYLTESGRREYQRQWRESHKSYYRDWVNKNKKLIN